MHVLCNAIRVAFRLGMKKAVKTVTIRETPPIMSSASRKQSTASNHLQQPGQHSLHQKSNETSASDCSRRYPQKPRRKQQSSVLSHIQTKKLSLSQKDGYIFRSHVDIRDFSAKVDFVGTLLEKESKHNWTRGRRQ